MVALSSTEAPEPVAEIRLRLGPHRYGFPGPTLVMGVVNVTPDSFSDGGQQLAPDAAIAHGLRLARAGADILDIGGESTRPGAAPVDAGVEIDRVCPVIRALAERCEQPISVDTSKAEVAAAAVEAGATLINDISGLRFDPQIATVAAQHEVGLALMHSRRTPRDMQQGVEQAYEDVVAEVVSFLAAALRQAVLAGVNPESTLLDPGIGFGKTVAHNLTLLRNLRAVAALGRPVLVGTSRKSFLGALTGRPVDQRLAGTLASITAAALSGAHVARVHDVGASVDALKVADALRGAVVGC